MSFERSLNMAVKFIIDSASDVLPSECKKLDVTHIPEVTIGDLVTVFGVAPALTAEQLAAANGTIGYEVVCGVGERVPRLYVEQGRLVDALDNLMR